MPASAKARSAGCGAGNDTCQRPLPSSVTLAIPSFPAGSGRESRNLISLARVSPCFGTTTAAHLRLSFRTRTSRIQNPSFTARLRHVGRRCVPAHRFLNACWKVSERLLLHRA
jgi:hypothetical protein